MSAWILYRKEDGEKTCTWIRAANVTVAAYSVSGEYAMVKAAAKMGWIDEERIIGEMAVGAYRAGAQIYITYFAEEIAKMMEEGRIG